MAVTLFFKECKGILKSVTYYIFIVFTTVFLIGQMDSIEMIKKPQKGAESYGWKYSKEKSIIMKSAVEQLLADLSRNSFGTYPIGFYKQVTLSKQEINEIFSILEEVVGMSSEQLRKVEKDITMIQEVEVKKEISYEEFCDYFNRIDDILGGGSDYARKRLHVNGRVNKTYEDAVNEYESILEDDLVSRAYARLFGDYMGIVLAILPIFLAVTRVLKDRRAKAEQVVNSKRCSSTIIILSRYLAIVVMILLPVLLLSINPLLQTVYIASSNGITADYFAFLKVIFGWLCPTILFTVSMGFLLTEISNGPVAILIQGAFWILSVFMAASNLVGYVGMNLIPRFNEVGSYDIYQSIYKELVVNRGCYSLVSILMLTVSIIVYERKRKGRLGFDRAICKHSKG